MLDGLEVVRLATGYRIGGRHSDILPVGAEELYGCEPVYEDMPGWKETTVGATRLEELPAAARNYLKRIATICEVPIDLVSTGADRAQTIVMRHPFK